MQDSKPDKGKKTARASTSSKNRPRSPSPYRSRAGQSTSEFVNEFWQHTVTTAEGLDEDFKHQALPLARIKKVMKSDPEVRMISSEVTVLFEKACQIFIQELTARSHLVSLASRRRTLSRPDVAQAISRSDMFDFLIDIVPREDGWEPETGSGVAGGVRKKSKSKGKGRATPAAAPPPKKRKFSDEVEEDSMEGEEEEDDADGEGPGDADEDEDGEGREGTTEEDGHHMEHNGGGNDSVSAAVATEKLLEQFRQEQAMAGGQTDPGGNMGQQQNQTFAPVDGGLNWNGGFDYSSVGQPPNFFNPGGSA